MLRCCGRWLRRGRTRRLAAFLTRRSGWGDALRRRCGGRHRMRCGRGGRRMRRRRWCCRMRRRRRVRRRRRRRRCWTRRRRRCRVRWGRRRRGRTWRRCRLCRGRCRLLVLLFRRRRGLRQPLPAFALRRGGETRGLEAQKGGAGQQKCCHGILRQARTHIDLVPECSLRRVESEPTGNVWSIQGAAMQLVPAAQDKSSRRRRS